MDGSKGKKMLKSGANKICTLPDGVLHRILSFLDMKEVVATSLLSTRWRYLWASVPVLNFSDSMWKMKSNVNKLRPKMFMDFVDRVLLLQDCSNISRCQITCSFYCDSDRINAWLTVAARRHFQEIHLELVMPKIMEFPYFYLISSLITVLKLDGGMWHDDLDQVQIPSWICCSPVLKTLLLCSYKLPDGNSDGELVFSNAVLENLTLKECNQAHLNVLNISTFRLKNLVFLNDNDDTIGDSQTKICTPNLASIDFGGFCYDDCCFGNLSSLVNAKFHFAAVNPWPLAKVLDCVSCPTTLEICSSLEDYWLNAETFPWKLTRPYVNVRCLKFSEWGDSQSINGYMLNIMSLCSCLETLYFDDYVIEDQEEKCEFPITFYHLKHVEINCLTVHQNELKFLKFLLKNAIILEKLVIGMDIRSRDLEAKRDFGDKIHYLTRASPRLTVLLL